MVTLDSLRADFAILRLRMGAAAISIANTEDWIATTLEQMARERPEHGPRLRARAAEAREIAALERDRAVMYGCDPSADRRQAEEELDQDN